MPRAMEHQAALLFRRLGRDEPHVGSGDRLADRFGVSGIVLLPLDVGLHVSRRHQPYRMPKRLQFARPMMRCRAGLHTNEARRHFLEERQDVATLPLTAEDHLAIGVNAVHLKTRLGDVETDCLNCLHVWLLSIVGALTAPTFMALACRWRSRPQHQKRTFIRAAGMSALCQKRTLFSSAKELIQSPRPRVNVRTCAPNRAWHGRSGRDRGPLR